MPIYEYNCPQHGKFEALRGIEEMKSTLCPLCYLISERVYNSFNFKMYNPFRKDGEGFSSVKYRPEEYQERVKNNLSKDEKV